VTWQRYTSGMHNNTPAVEVHKRHVKPVGEALQRGRIGVVDRNKPSKLVVENSSDLRVAK
jgi:hypothetical protein